jgi:hypothetical protein
MGKFSKTKWKTFYAHKMKCPCKIWQSQQFWNFRIANDQLKFQDAKGCFDATKEKQKQVHQSLRMLKWELNTLKEKEELEKA